MGINPFEFIFNNKNKAMKVNPKNIFASVFLSIFFLIGTIDAQNCIRHTSIKYEGKKKVTRVTGDMMGEYIIKESSNLDLSENDIWSQVAYDSFGGKVVKNQFIIRFKKATSEIQKQAVRTNYDAIVIEKVANAVCEVELELWHCDFDSIAGITIEEKKGDVSTTPIIEGVDFNYITVPVPVSQTSEDGYSSSFQPSSASKVAVIDNGMDEEHPMIRGHIANRTGYDFINQDDDPNDENSAHGTHMASNILHYSNHQASLINLKVFENGSNKNSLFFATAATYLAACKGADVINMSWGWVGAPAQCLKDAIEYAGEQNCALVVCSAGNDSLNLNQDNHYPSGYNLNNIISITALDNSGAYASYANYGGKVDIAVKGEFFGAIPNGKSGMMKGTSVSTASVSGIAARLISLNPEAGYTDVILPIFKERTTIPDCIAHCNIGLPLTARVIERIMNSETASSCRQSSEYDSNRMNLNTNVEKYDFTFLANKLTVNLNLESDSKVEVLVADIAGRVIYSQKDYMLTGFHGLSFNLSNQPKGMYFITLLVNGERFVKKIVR